MKKTEPSKELPIFQLAKPHLFFAIFRITIIASLAFLFFCKNKLPGATAATVLGIIAGLEIVLFFLIYAKTFTRKESVNFPHFVLLILQIGTLGSFANYSSGGNFKSTLFIAGATIIVAVFYFITFLLKRKIAK